MHVPGDDVAAGTVDIEYAGCLIETTKSWYAVMEEHGQEIQWGVLRRGGRESWSGHRALEVCERPCAPERPGLALCRLQVESCETSEPHEGETRARGPKFPPGRGHSLNHPGLLIVSGIFLHGRLLEALGAF